MVAGQRPGMLPVSEKRFRDDRWTANQWARRERIDTTALAQPSPSPIIFPQPGTKLLMITLNGRRVGVDVSFPIFRWHLIQRFSIMAIKMNSFLLPPFFGFLPLGWETDFTAALRGAEQREINRAVAHACFHVPCALQFTWWQVSQST